MAIQAHVESLSDRSAEAIGLFVRLTRAIEHGRFVQAVEIRSRLNELGFVLSFKPEQSRRGRRLGGSSTPLSGPAEDARDAQVMDPFIKPLAPAASRGQAALLRHRWHADVLGPVGGPTG